MQGVVVSTMVLVLLFLVAGNLVMLRPGAGEADAREVPAAEDGGGGDPEATGDWTIEAL